MLMSMTKIFFFFKDDFDKDYIRYLWDIFIRKNKNKIERYLLYNKYFNKMVI